MSIGDIYEHVIRPLPPGDRLRLATRILNDLPPESVVDYNTSWSEEDMLDASHFSLEQAARSLGEETDVA